MLGDQNVATVVLAGVLGALAMALVSAVFNAVRVPMVDLGRLIATKLLRYHSHGTKLGLALHLINGVVLAFVYAVAVDRLLPGPYWARGLTYGLGLWLLLMLVILPLLGDGFFGRRSGWAMGPSALAIHLVYGLILGFAFR